MKPSRDDVLLVAGEPAPVNSLPDWHECALRVANSDFIEKRISEGGYGPEPDAKLASQLHRFIHEYDDADAYGSEWFLHRLELVLRECRAEGYAAGAEDMARYAMHLQARIDALMLEFCLDEMTTEQIAECERNQRPITPTNEGEQ